MLAQFENSAAIGTLALKNTRGIMQPMGQHMHFGIGPRHHLAVHPDKTVALIKSDTHLGVSLGSLGAPFGLFYFAGFILQEKKPNHVRLNSVLNLCQ